MINNPYEMSELNKQNIENVARTMEQYGAPERKKGRSVLALWMGAILTLVTLLALVLGG